MNSLLSKLINFKPEEATQVYLLLAYGFCTGIFLATYDVSAPALFLDQFQNGADSLFGINLSFGDSNVLAFAILTSGLIGIAATFVYSYLQVKIPFPVLALGFLTLIFGLTFYVWFELTFTRTPEFVFIAFVLALPINYIVLLIFWGSFGRIFNLKQSKRLIGGIDSGQLIASILALFLIGYIVDQGIINTTQLLFISTLAVGLLTFVFFVISRNNSLKQATKHTKTKSFPYSGIIKTKYLRLLAGFVLISLICASFVEYSFLSVTDDQWAGESEKATFLALFEGTLVIFSFLFQTFVTDWLIENYGLKIALLINPILIAVLTGAALIVGLSLGYDVTDPTVNFIYFFLAIAAIKLFIDSLRDALDGPSFKLYFLPIDKEYKFDIVTKIEGVVTALGGVIAGALLIIMNSFQLDLLAVTIGLVPLLLGWYFVTNKMHSGYKLTLENTLLKNQSSSSESMHPNVASILKPNEEASKAHNLASLNFMKTVEPVLYESALLQLSSSSNKSFQEFANQKVVTNPETSQALANAALDQLDSTDKSQVTVNEEELYTLARSHKKTDRLKAANLFQIDTNKKTVFVLLDLMRDIDEEVKLHAIIAARKSQRPETWSLLIDLLESPRFSYEAAAALVEAGHPCLETLENAYQKSGQTKQTALKIVQILDRIGEEQAIGLIWNKIEVPDRKIFRQVLISLIHHNYQASGTEPTKVIELLEAEIGKAIWNMAAESELGENARYDPLRAALEYEVKSNFSFIYLLLSLIYEPRSIQLVRENIESGTTEGSAFAMELLDMFIDQNLKLRLFPLIDDGTLKEKLAKLQNFYPRQSYNQLQTVNYIINRDINNINRWTKACALEVLPLLRGAKISDGLVAQLFNPDPLIWQVAGMTINQLDKRMLKKVFYRIPTKTQRGLEFFIKGENIEDNIQKFLLNNIKRLNTSTSFDGIPEILCSQIADSITVIELASSQTITNAGADDSILFIARGCVSVQLKNEQSIDVSNDDLAGVIFLHNSNDEIQQMTAVEDSTVFVINIYSFFSVMANYTELAQQFIKMPPRLT